MLELELINVEQQLVLLKLLQRKKEKMSEETMCTTIKLIEAE